MRILSGGTSLDLDSDFVGDEEDEEAELEAGVGVGLRIDFGLVAGDFGSEGGELAGGFGAVLAFPF